MPLNVPSTVESKNTPTQSQVNYFREKFTDVSYVGKRFQNFYCSNHTLPLPCGVQTLTFNFPAREGRQVLDFSDSYIKVSLRLYIQEDGVLTVPASRYWVAYSNDVCNSLWRQVQVSVGGQALVSEEVRHDYSSQITLACNYDNETRASTMSSAGYSVPHGLGQQDATEPDFLERQKLLHPHGSPAEFVGKLNHSLINASDPLPPGVAVSMTLTSNEPNVFIQQYTETYRPQEPHIQERRNYTYAITDCVLVVRVCELSVDVFEHFMAKLKSKQKLAIYFTRYNCHFKSILAGNMTHVWTEYTNRPLPQGLVIAFVYTKYFRGTQDSNPFDYTRVITEVPVILPSDLPFPGSPVQDDYVEPCYVQKVTCNVNGIGVSGPPIVDKYTCVRENHFRFQKYCGMVDGNCNNGLTLEKYMHGRYFIGQDLTVSQRCFDLSYTPQTLLGSLALSINFSKELPAGVTLLVVSQTRGFITIDLGGAVTLSYTT